LRGWRERIEELGARLVFVGSGAPAFAMDFQRAHAPDCLVLTDPSGASYAALGAVRGVLSTFSPRVLGSYRRALAAGFRLTETRGDALQQGGVLVVLPPNRVVYRHLSRVPGDHPAPEAVVAALRAAGVPT
jgi:hypothetical protein